MPTPSAEPREPDIDDSSLTDLDEPLDPDLDIYRSRLTGDHTGAQGHGEIAESVLDGADLSGSRFDPLELVDVRISKADLSNATWEGITARRLAVEDCRSVGWRVIVDFAEDVVVQRCKWVHGGIYLAKSRGAVVFRDCSFDGTTIRGDLSRVRFEGCDLAGAEFNASAAAGCDLRSSRLTGAQGLLTLRGAKIGPDQLVELAELIVAEAGFEVG